MKRKLLLLGVLAMALTFGLVLAGCDDGGSGDNEKSIEKSVRTTGLGDYKDVYYEVGIATSIHNLLNETLVAYTEEGRINSATVTAKLFDYKTGKPWTGSGSYYVGVKLWHVGSFATSSKHSFNNAVTTLSIDDFEEY
ncbi:MAG: hypothetical protein LBK73_15230 [Treponema sp.]|jgi:hypothetical protein|nr:hypothetical protein [Treponema sp.]